MKSLIDFFESKLGRKVNIYPYSIGDSLSSCAEIVSWNEETYAVELVDDFLDNNLRGYFYTIYQQNINEEVLNQVFYSLYDDIKIINFEGNYIININDKLLVDKSTPQIVELESYTKTYIICLGEVKSREELDFKVKLSNRLKKYIFIENSDRKYFDIYDLALYNIIDYVGCNDIYGKLFDYTLIDKVDSLVLEAGIAFIENGFNISKTSSSIYLHRNTLIYRLDKIKDALGIDIRNFNEAVVYYVIVKNYLISKKI
ncbi:MAG: helix-turn-helix domain-containing protein [Paraclostridium sp.]